MNMHALCSDDGMHDWCFEGSAFAGFGFALVSEVLLANMCFGSGSVLVSQASVSHVSVSACMSNCFASGLALVLKVSVSI